MGLVRLPLTKIREGRSELPREAAHYLCTVHRLGPGATFLAFDPELGNQAEGSIVAVERGRVECEFVAPLAAPPGGIGVTLFQGTVKGDRMEYVVRAATALGADAVHWVVTERSVALPGELRRDRLRLLAIEAARQCGRGDLPRIEGPESLPHALPKAADCALRICLVPGAGAPLAEILGATPPGTRTAFLIGSEGGLNEFELEAAREQGFVAASLGPFVLRTELAAVAALACAAARLSSR
jgi:16S rRNA (uracil1498-N3)-methyltransferase